MKMACAECGCVIEARTRVNACPDEACCCAYLPSAADAELNGERSEHAARATPSDRRG